MTRAVIDTNVIISAVLTPFGAPAGVLNSFLSGGLALLYDDRIIAEYRQVLERKKFNFESDLVADILDYIKLKGENICADPLNIKLNDPFDLPFIEVAASGHADWLITGNKKHFPQKILTAKIVTPSEFLAKL